jgi:multicomponent K+:H+ antiporter subunit D
MLTAVVGFAGVFTARTLSEQASYAIIGSTGTLLIAVAGWQAATLGAALYYLVHSTIAGAALFLISDVVARRRAGFADNVGSATRSGPDFAQRQGVGLMFMAAAIATAGLPPLSGFIGKLLILKSVAGLPDWGWAWGVILSTTLIGVIGFARAGSAVFWKSAGTQDTTPAPAAKGDLAAPIIALVLLAALSAGAGWATAYADAAAAQVLDPTVAARAVLGEVAR